MMRDQFRRILTRHYFDLRGPASREEFWTFVLGALIVYGAVWAGTFALSQIAHRLTPAMNCVCSLVALALLPPLAALGVRRLKDVGQSGWLVATLLVPVAVMQIAGLLAREPFLILNAYYFYVDDGWLFNLTALIASVALTSFWIQPGSSARSMPTQGVTQ